MQNQSVGANSSIPTASASNERSNSASRFKQFAMKCVRNTPCLLLTAGVIVGAAAIAFALTGITFMVVPLVVVGGALITASIVSGMLRGCTNPEDATNADNAGTANDAFEMDTRPNTDTPDTPEGTRQMWPPRPPSAKSRAENTSQYSEEPGHNEAPMPNFRPSRIRARAAVNQPHGTKNDPPQLHLSRLRAQVTNVPKDEEEEQPSQQQPLPRRQGQRQRQRVLASSISFTGNNENQTTSDQSK